MLPNEFETAFIAAQTQEDRLVVLQIAGDWFEEQGKNAFAKICRNQARIPLVWCPPGRFQMGSPRNENLAFVGETQFEMTLTQGFWLGQYPITQEQWGQVMLTSVRDQAKLGTYTKALRGEGPRHPMYYVSWEDAQQFCKTYSQLEQQANRLPEGWVYELPTEAQWEYACRAGFKTRFCFGDNEAQLHNYAWYYENSKSQTHEVGQKKANAWGLYDMHGNVWEWCRDCYEDWLGEGHIDPYKQGGLLRVYRGGGWDSDARDCRSANRNRYLPNTRYSILGFRLALVAQM